MAATAHEHDIPCAGARAVAPWRLRALVGASLAAAPLVASAHVVPGPAAWSLHWSLEPWVVACLAISALGYASGLGRLWSRAGRGRGISRAQAAAFGGGWLALAVALVSPLDPLGVQLFSAHMIQHEMLMVLVAPLLCLGRPLVAWTWSMPPRWRRRVGRWTARRGWRSAWGAMTSLLGSWALHAAALWGWHAPSLFQAALHDNGIHVLQHVSFLGSALLFWWAALRPASRRGQGHAIVYVFTTMMHTSALGALLTLSPAVWYPDYLPSALALGIDPLEDQQLGGLVMWIPAGLAYVVAGLALALRWAGLRSSDHIEGELRAAR
jgi:putative membrane protein